jgi:hypothetical protein
MVRVHRKDGNKKRKCSTKFTDGVTETPLHQLSQNASDSSDSCSSDSLDSSDSDTDNVCDSSSSQNGLDNTNIEDAFEEEKQKGKPDLEKWGLSPQQQAKARKAIQKTISDLNLEAGKHNISEKRTGGVPLAKNSSINYLKHYDGLGRFFCMIKDWQSVLGLCLIHYTIVMILI